MDREPDPIAALNALPDISGNDSERLQGFMRMTATEIKAIGGVSAATSLEMIGYIRELERKLNDPCLVAGYHVCGGVHDLSDPWKG